MHDFVRTNGVTRWLGRSVVLTAALTALLAFSAVFAQGPDGGELGASTYAQCAACHQPTGFGIPSAFPPLVGHAPDLYAVEGGREYLAKLVLYGLMGQVTIEGASYNGVMPANAHLDDASLAAALNYVLHAWGNGELLPEEFEPFTPEDIAAQRDLGLSPMNVYELRSSLDLD